MRFIRSIFITALMALTTVSCTVKEDRALAPCWLVADLSPCSGEAILYGDALTEQFCDTVDASRMHEYVKAVPRGTLDFTAVLLQEEALSAVSEGRIVCRDGQMFPRIRIHHESFITLGQEEVHTTVFPHKRWCDIRLMLPSELKSLSEIVVVKVLGTSVGYNLDDGSPLKGSFSFITGLSREGSAVVSVPQQWSDDLCVIIYVDGKATKTVPLGELLRESGYNWNEADLQDVTYVLEVENVSGTIVIGDWDLIDDPVENPES